MNTDTPNVRFERARKATAELALLVVAVTDDLGLDPEETSLTLRGKDGAEDRSLTLSQAIQNLTDTVMALDPAKAKPATPLTDAQILELRDALLPSQGEAFDCVAFARLVLSVDCQAAARHDMLADQDTARRLIQQRIDRWERGLSRRQALMKADCQAPEFYEGLKSRIDLLRWCITDLESLLRLEELPVDRIP